MQPAPRRGSRGILKRRGGEIARKAESKDENDDVGVKLSKVSRRYAFFENHCQRRARAHVENRETGGCNLFRDRTGSDGNESERVLYANASQTHRAHVRKLREREASQNGVLPWSSRSFCLVLTCMPRRCVSKSRNLRSRGFPNHNFNVADANASGKSSRNAEPAKTAA